MADILLNAAKGTPVEEIQHILENDAVQHQVLGNAVLESLGEMKGLSDKCRNKSWLASIPSPRFLPYTSYTIWMQFVHLKTWISYYLAIEWASLPWNLSFFCKAKLGSNPCLPNCQISQQVYLYHYKHGTCCCWVSQSYHDRKKRTTSTSIIALHWICRSLWKRIIQCDLELNIWRGRRHTNLSTRSIRCCIFLRRIICFWKTC